MGQQFSLNSDNANDILGNIMEANGRGNRVPVSVEKMTLDYKINRKLFTVPATLIAILMVLTLIAPLCLPTISRSLMGTFGPKEASLVSDDLSDQILTLSFTGDNIRFDKAYIMYPNGTYDIPLSYNDKAKTVMFRYSNEEEINVYIPVDDASTLHLLITPIN